MLNGYEISFQTDENLWTYTEVIATQHSEYTKCNLTTYFKRISLLCDFYLTEKNVAALIIPCVFYLKEYDVNMVLLVLTNYLLPWVDGWNVHGVDSKIKFSTHYNQRC